MDTVVLYKSVTGFTKKYALWISEELKCDVFDVKKFNFKNLQSYGTVIYGGGLFAGNIRGFKKFIKSQGLKGKNLIVFATGSSPDNEKTLDEIREKNLSSDTGKNIKLFYFPGGMDTSKLGFFSRLLIRLMVKAYRRKKDLNEDDKKMLEMFSEHSDSTDKSKIAPLTEYAASLK